ncbi:MAG TPA: kelch repeat-containing protein [Bacteroidia bacterium]|nr:kelch repeat-containing protein [Bacteroidia bacterium]
MKKILRTFVFCFLCGECFSQGGTWTWMAGTDSIDAKGVYGIMGVPSPANHPPVIYEGVEFTDKQGNFWLYGGCNQLIPVQYADLWKFDPVTYEWTWMKGPGGGSIECPVYGIKGVSSPNNTPGIRYVGTGSTVDTSGNFWLFGGYGCFNAMNDLWKFDPTILEWTWVSGDSIPGQPGVFGTYQVPGINNIPPSRAEFSTMWTDNNNNIWLFGGQELTATSALNDLWRYNILTGEWTWMHGSNSTWAQGIYGTKGVSDPLNTPGGRWSYSHWKDGDGNLWLYAGLSPDSVMGSVFYCFNDLWKFNLMNNEWTWINGSNQPGDTGSCSGSCITDSINQPGTRFESRAVWKDQNDNFYFYGSVRGALGSFAAKTDLWMYCLNTGQWTLVNGDFYQTLNANYGTYQVPSPSNFPGSKFGANAWKDADENFWLFGGYYASMWRFTLDTACGVCPVPNSVHQNNPPKADELLIFPNPANSSFTILFSSAERQTIQLRIYNSLGEQIYFSKEVIAKGKFEKEINAENLSSGIYFLQLQMKNGMMSRKVLVER